LLVNELKFEYNIKEHECETGKEGENTGINEDDKA
jgi:hypothetical protein